MAVNQGRLTGGSSSGYALGNAVSVSSGATLTQADLSLFELTGSFTDVAGAVLASPNQSSSPYAIGSRGILFDQGGAVTVNGTIRPIAPNSNRFGVIGVNDNPSSSSATAMTNKGVVTS